MNVEENEIECEDCGHNVSGNLLKENFVEIHLNRNIKKRCFVFSLG